MPIDVAKKTNRCEPEPKVGLKRRTKSKETLVASNEVFKENCDARKPAQIYRA